MATIVLYRDDSPVNAYPDRIVSPTRPGSCCPSSMAALGSPWVEGRASFQYWRCAGCGFTVRRVVGTTPDPAILQSVRQAFQSLFGDRRLASAEPRHAPSAPGPVSDTVVPRPANPQPEEPAARPSEPEHDHIPMPQQPDADQAW
jgi:hypothetical protein